MERKIREFPRLVIETQSVCNRKCPTCLRQTHPQREKLKGEMPSEMVYDILDQAWDMGHRKMVVLQFFNEPLFDKRLPDFAKYAMEKGFDPVVACSNGDILTPEIAESIDPYFHQLNISLNDQAAFKRRKYIGGLFKSAKVAFRSVHHLTHYDPRETLNEAIRRQSSKPCFAGCRQNMIIGFDGKMRLCCQDPLGEFDLGSVSDTSVEDLWYSEKHQEIILTLGKPGGRKKYPYCAICPVG